MGALIVTVQPKAQHRNKTGNNLFCVDLFAKESANSLKLVILLIEVSSYIENFIIKPFSVQY